MKAGSASLQQRAVRLMRSVTAGQRGPDDGAAAGPVLHDDAFVQGLEVMLQRLEEWMAKQEGTSQKLLAGQEAIASFLQGHWGGESIAQAGPAALAQCMARAPVEMAPQGLGEAGPETPGQSSALDERTARWTPQQPVGPMQSDDLPELLIDPPSATASKDSAAPSNFHTEGEVCGAERQDLLQDVRKHWCRPQTKKLQLSWVPISHNAQVTSEARRPRLVRFITSQLFESIAMCVIALNAVLIGLQVESSAAALSLSEEARPLFFSVGEAIFTALFCAELALRCRVYGLQFFTSSGCGWNIFDVVVVVLMLLGQAQQYSPQLGTMPFSQIADLRLLRVVRLLRAFRFVQAFDSLHGLRVLLQTVLVAVRSIVWAVLVVLFTLYVFGVLMTQGVLEHLAGHPELRDGGEVEELLASFGTLDRSMLTLFKIMTAGIPWHELMPAIFLLERIYLAIFLTYVAVAYFAILNIVTGVFVETTIQVAKQDRDFAIRNEMHSKASYSKKLQEIFIEMDLDVSQSLTVGEFEHAMQDQRVVAYFNTLGLDFADIATLFVLLDRDQSGALTLDEFILGCMRLKGEARSLDIAKLQYHAEWVMHNLSHLMDTVTDLSSHLCGGDSPSSDPGNGAPRRVSTTASAGTMLPSLVVPEYFKTPAQKENSGRVSHVQSAAALTSITEH